MEQTKIFIDLTIVSFLTWLLVNIAYFTEGKPESDRQEALEKFRTHKYTSQGNPITTGWFSFILSVPFTKIKYLNILFWVWLMFTLTYEQVPIWIILLFFPFMLRTALYRLEEVYFILIPVYYALHGYWFLWICVLFWRNPFASREVLKKKQNPRALVLDYILLLLIIVLGYKFIPCFHIINSLYYAN